MGGKPRLDLEIGKSSIELRIEPVDDRGRHTSCSIGDGLRGKQLVGPHGHWETITLVVGLRHDGMVAMARFVRGASNSGRYDRG